MKKYDRQKRAKYGQNYIKNPSIARALLKQSDINNKDAVLEVGLGEGVFTAELLKIAGKVLAIDIDGENISRARRKFRKEINEKRLFLKTEDALRFVHKFAGLPLEHADYKLFSSVPYNISSQFVKKFLIKKPMPKSAFLILQKEFADRVLGKDKNSVLSVLVKSFFDVKVLSELRREIFSPIPSVDSVFTAFYLKEDIPAELLANLGDYKDFVRAGFTEPIKTVEKYFSKFLSKKDLQELANRQGFKIKDPSISLSANDWELMFRTWKSGTDL